ncbi:hypothetical protein [Nannocystis pusilla]|uniref:MYXO-CTERM domain-containing protein n=1 Tax=Nannocystis pusilla TaxID=889268 RepID=A0ABS7THT8_9BACT|nr:hypothetical protein [Nannocystis pusilla]MBZ5707770.1 hypothetical protein [Nannocystis pusilla]
MHRRVLASGLAVAVIAFTPGAARADVIISLPDRIDLHCTLEEQCPTGVVCEYGSLDRIAVGADCRAEARKKGWERRCRYGGPSGGTEVFCPLGATGSWAMPGRPVKDVPDSVEVPGAEAEPASAPPSPAGGPATLPPEPPRSTTNSCAVGDAGLGAVWLVLAFTLLRRRRP